MNATAIDARDIVHDWRWQAVLDLDATHAAAFVYAVRSTGIYCRAGCPARTPRRDGVLFFGTPEDAEARGYRACLRCSPSGPDPTVELVTQACRYIEAHASERPTLVTLGRQLGVDPSHLQRTFVRIVGISPRQYGEKSRLTSWKAHARQGAGVTEAIAEAGYGSSRALYEHADEALGMSPGRYRRGGAGIRMAYTVTVSPLGLLLVAGTDCGVSSVQLGNDEPALIASLCSEYPRAKLVRDDGALREWVQTLLAYLNGREPHPNLPLDVRATAFQRLVWQELQRIPYGATRTYSEVAEAIGRPSATRAVAAACARNPVALIVPCHRVIRRDGDLAGYRWDVERKAALHRIERDGSE